MGVLRTPEQRFEGLRRFPFAPRYRARHPRVSGLGGLLGLTLRTRWSGPVRMAVGGADPLLGPAVMEDLRQTLRGCPEPLRLEGAGHFVQEWGEPIARWALEEFATDGE